MRRSVELDRKNTEISRNYTYLERQEEREFDGSGKPKNVEVHTYDVTKLEGSPYRRLVAINDKPLSLKDQKKEEAPAGSENKAREVTIRYDGQEYKILVQPNRAPATAGE